MHNVIYILQDCLIRLQQTENVVQVEARKILPNLHIATKYIDCWEIKPVITVQSIAKRITLYMCFDSSFPYSWPDIYFLDKQFDYLTHIGYDDRKLCLFPDEAMVNPQKPMEMIDCTLKCACRLLQENIDGKLNDDFKQEILSYWRYTYDKESYIGTGYLLSRSTLSEGVQLKVRLTNNGLFIYDETDSVANRILKNCCEESERTTYDVMFVSEYKLPDRPPYHITPTKVKQNALGSFENIKRFIAKHKNTYSYLLFSIPDTTSFGAVCIPPTPTRLKGFRPGMVSPMQYLFTMNKSDCLKRYTICPYDIERISERTSGCVATKRNYWIGGLGSVGSNLIYYLNSEQDVSFVLVDNELLTVDNVGRHFLGFPSIGKWKAEELKKYICSLRPERNVLACQASIEQILFSNKITSNIPDALFLCTGNTNAERYILEKLKDSIPEYPIFILWLEPYAIAGHMVYLNPNYGIPSDFLSTSYPYNLIAESEYNSEDKSFTKRESGCANTYTNYGGSDVVSFLSSIYPIIQQILQEPTKSTFYRWIGNINIAKEKGILLSTQDQLKKGEIQLFRI
ncbi:MAG: ThiF family adenylyltransferase [Paludibacteraceae bacterium]|nr:ThiF family adenylyltransferase [Paludibacteraceae bacterium]